MSIKEARKYITQLRKMQDDPARWPDYLTGLPDSSASARMLSKAYGKSGLSAVSYLRVINVHPYLGKYGPSRHIDVIEWAAAIIKTAADASGGCFAGSVGVHDFILIGKAKDVESAAEKAAGLFERKVRSFYNEEDRKRGHIFSYARDGENIEVGLMSLLAVTLTKAADLPKDNILERLRSITSNVELSNS